MSIYITATGLFTPPHQISNEELVASFNAYVEAYNHTHGEAIEQGSVKPLEPSSAEFIEKVSGIKSRYVMDKAGILDPTKMTPTLPKRVLGAQLSIMAEMGVAALQSALDSRGIAGQDLDGIILACSNFERPYPAISIEIQHAIGMTGGFAYDMNVACSAATFGIAQAVGCIKAGLAKRMAVVNVELTSAHLNWRNRDSHFIFGDVATATIIEAADLDKMTNPAEQDLLSRWYEIIDCELVTEFSTNIKNEFGFLNRATGLDEQDDLTSPTSERLFLQNGRSVFREVCPRVAKLIKHQLESNQCDTDDIKMMCLHQANANMIDLILRSVLGKEADKSIAPLVIDEFANTSSASPIIVFHRHHQRLQAGDMAVICSFGAGYSIGSILVRKV